MTKWLGPLLRFQRRPPAASLRSSVPYDQTFYSYESIDNHVDRLGGMPASWARKYTYGAAATGPTANITLEKSAAERSYRQKVEWLLDSFRKQNMLATRRPSTMPDVNTYPPFVYETTTARCFTIPQSRLPADMRLAALRIWMSEPDQSDFVDEEWNWEGSYLFLTELHLDGAGYHHIYSGCSALRMIANALASKDALHMEGAEILGRFDQRPISDKLIELGGIPSELKNIETLYRIRYMTDEQWHERSEIRRRVHDILGYPLMIRSTIAQ